MTTIKGRITIAVPVPDFVDPASMEKGAAVINRTHEAIGAFIAAIGRLGGSAAYRPGGRIGISEAAPPEPDRPSGTSPAQPVTDAGNETTTTPVDHFAPGPFVKVKNG